MTEERFKVFTDILTNEKNIVDMIPGEPLTIHQTCNLLNELNEDSQKFERAEQFIKELILDKEMLRKEINDLKELLDAYQSNQEK